MTLKEVYQEAKGRMKGFCPICSECNGKVCAGQVPGMGGCGSGSSFQNNYSTLKKLQLHMRCLHEVKNPDTHCSFLGKELAMPILGAPITGPKFNFGGYVTQEEFCDDIILGAKQCETLSMIGDSGDPTAYYAGIASIKKAKGDGIAIIKPRSNEEIKKRIKIAEEAGAFAVGIDLDGAGLLTMKLFNQPVEPKSIEDLKELVNSTKLPFLVKGILSIEEAEACVEAGVSAIVVSNHGGRVLDHCISSAQILAEIAQTLGDNLLILADGNVRTGEDVLKYLALGAKAVLVGRPCIWASVGHREEGMRILFQDLQAQLYKAMLMTGTASVKEVSSKVIFKNA